MNRKYILTGALLVVLGIGLGAFGAHALKAIINEKALISFETGVRYQIYHGLAFLFLGLLEAHQKDLKWVARFMLIGTILFSLSIYMLSTKELHGMGFKFLGPLTPIGGVLLILSWGLLIKKMLPQK